MGPLLQYGIFAALVLVILVPGVFMIVKNERVRMQLGSFGCFSCVKWFDNLCAPRVHYDASDLRTLQELEEEQRPAAIGINGAYRAMQARRARLALRLASWREDLRHGRATMTPDDLKVKLHKIQASDRYSRTGEYHPAVPVPTAAAPVAEESFTHSQRSVSHVPIEIQLDSVEASPVHSTHSAYEQMPTTPTSAAAAPSRRQHDLLSDDEEKEEIV